MMDRSYFSKQLSGPVIAVVTEAIYDFLHSFVDTLCDYFKNLSITTADSNHLDFIGHLTGFARPYYPGDEILTYFIRFDENYRQPGEPALKLSSTYEEWSYGTEEGIFAATTEGGYGGETSPASDALYRELLQALTTVETNLNSRRSLYTITRIFLGSDDFSFIDDEVLPDRVGFYPGESIPRLEAITLFSLLMNAYKGVLDMRLHLPEASL